MNDNTLLKNMQSLKLTSKIPKWLCILFYECLDNFGRRSIYWVFTKTPHIWQTNSWLYYEIILITLILLYFIKTLFFKDKTMFKVETWQMGLYRIPKVRAQFKIFKKELHLPSRFAKTGNLFWPDFAFLFIRGVRTGRTGLNN